MATAEEIVRDVIENHEKQSFDSASNEFKDTVLNALNRAIRYFYNAADWSFRTNLADNFSYSGSGGNNPLPDDFLSLNKTGAVFLLNGSVAVKELAYMSEPELLRLVYGPPGVNNSGDPRYFATCAQLGNTLSTREIKLFPDTPCTLRILYQAVAPGPYIRDGNWQDPIERIPASWHYVLRDMTVVFRLIDKEGDSSRMQDLLKTSMKEALEQEPNGRENPLVVLAKKLPFRMNRFGRRR